MNGKDTDNSKKLDKELENAAVTADQENQAINLTASVLESAEEDEFVSVTHYPKKSQKEFQETENEQLTNDMAANSEIQKFYKDKCVFLTGGTGYLGKVLIQKLLRSCGDIDTIYVLVRSKKGKDPMIRIRDMLDEFIFHKAHEVNPKGIHKVVPIVGDVGLPGIGLSDKDRQLLISRVNIIIHAAATVRFNEKLSIATDINVKGTKETIKLAKECKNLIAFTHVSTAYSNTHVDHIKEKFYEPPMPIESLEAVVKLDDNVIESILPSLIGDRPNTYCFTKAIAEDAVRTYGEGMPICVIRPSIVISTYDEPVRGWSDSMYGPTGIVVGFGIGVIRTLWMDLKKVVDFVPVDRTVNAIIVSAYHTANQFTKNQTYHVPVYNYVSRPQNPLTWQEYIDSNYKHSINKPTIKALWYFGFTPTSNYYLFLFYNFFLHFLPALLTDVYCALTGKKRRMLKFYNKLTKLSTILFYFMNNEWIFDNNNVRDMWSSISAQDKTLFPFDIGQMSWDYFMETFMLGIREYILKDDISTLPEARKKVAKVILSPSIGENYSFIRSFVFRLFIIQRFIWSCLVVFNTFLNILKLNK